MCKVESTELTRALAAGRAAWPTVKLEERDLAAFLASGGIPEQAIRQHGADLCLAAACVARIPEALACFDARFLSRVDRYLGRMRLPPDFVDEIRQQLRIRMIGPEARIGRYSGIAALDRWLRLACVRLALDAIDAEARRRQPDGASELLERVATADNPELNAIHSRHAHVVQDELRRAFERLSPRDKTLLRLHFVEGLNIESIGEIYRVHRASAARWIASIRSRLLEEVRQHVQLKIGSTPSEAASLVQHVHQKLALSVSRLLAP